MPVIAGGKYCSWPEIRKVRTQWRRQLCLTAGCSAKISIDHLLSCVVQVYLFGVAFALLPCRVCAELQLSGGQDKHGRYTIMLHHAYASVRGTLTMTCRCKAALISSTRSDHTMEDCSAHTVSALHAHTMCHEHQSKVSTKRVSVSSMARLK